MDLTFDAAIDQLDQALKALGSPARAAKEKAYLKSPLTFYGVGVPLIRQLAKETARLHQDIPADALFRLVAVLWWTQVHEMRSLAIAILEKKSKQLAPEHLELLIELVRDSHTWAHVDWLAIKVIGPLAAQAPNQADTLRQWAEDDNFWVRRTAILAQLDRLKAGSGDFNLFAELATPLLGDKEFFIRKAIGWVLREVSKKRPERTLAYLQAHRGRMSGLTLREGAKRLSAEQRQQLGLR